MGGIQVGVEVHSLEFSSHHFQALISGWMTFIIIHCHYHCGKNIEIKVDIQRSNGRIHSAVISGVNAEVQSVTVEWFEGGETKGKEVRACNA